MSAGHLPYRAGGHAVAAYLHGVRIDELGLAGITLWVPRRTSRRTELLADLAVGLAGIAAVSRYRFGWVGREEPVVTWSFFASELEDFREVHAIVRELAPLGDDDVLFQTWSQAVELVSSPLYWRAIERVGLSAVPGPLIGAESRNIIEEVLAGDGEQVIFPPAKGLA